MSASKGRLDAVRPKGHRAMDQVLRLRGTVTGQLAKPPEAFKIAELDIFVILSLCNVPAVKACEAVDVPIWIE